LSAQVSHLLKYSDLVRHSRAALQVHRIADLQVTGRVPAAVGVVEDEIKDRPLNRGEFAVGWPNESRHVRPFRLGPLIATAAGPPCPR